MDNHLFHYHHCEQVYFLIVILNWILFIFSCLGIRTVQLYDKFNERLDMSALLVDIHFKPGTLVF